MRGPLQHLSCYADSVPQRGHRSTGQIGGHMHPKAIFTLVLGGLLATGAAATTLSFNAAQNYDVGSRQTAVATGDVNGDGYADIVVGTYNGVSVLLNRGNGTFDVQAPFVLPRGGMCK